MISWIRRSNLIEKPEADLLARDLLGSIRPPGEGFLLVRVHGSSSCVTRGLHLVRLTFAFSDIWKQNRYVRCSFVSCVWGGTPGRKGPREKKFSRRSMMSQGENSQ